MTIISVCCKGLQFQVHFTSGLRIVLGDLNNNKNVHHVVRPGMSLILDKIFNLQSRPLASVQSLNTGQWPSNDDSTRPHHSYLAQHLRPATRTDPGADLHSSCCLSCSPLLYPTIVSDPLTGLSVSIRQLDLWTTRSNEGNSIPRYPLRLPYQPASVAWSTVVYHERCKCQHRR